MSTDVEIEIFASELFEAMFEMHYNEHCRVSLTQAYDQERESHLTTEICSAVAVRIVFYHFTLTEELEKDLEIFSKSLMDIYQYLKDVMHNLGFLEGHRTMEAVFMSCAFLISINTYLRQSHLNALYQKHFYLIWAMFFDTELKTRFYAEGGWEVLKEAAKSYVQPLFTIKVFRRLCSTAIATKAFRISIDDYDRFVRERKSVKTCSRVKEWISLRVLDNEPLSLKHENKTIYEIFMGIEEELVSFKRFLNPLNEKTSHEFFEIKNNCSNDKSFTCELLGKSEDCIAPKELEVKHSQTNKDSSVADCLAKINLPNKKPVDIPEIFEGSGKNDGKKCSNFEKVSPLMTTDGVSSSEENCDLKNDLNNCSITELASSYTLCNLDKTHVSTKSKHLGKENCKFGICNYYTSPVKVDDPIKDPNRDEPNQNIFYRSTEDDEARSTKESGNWNLNEIFFEAKEKMKNKSLQKAIDNFRNLYSTENIIIEESGSDQMDPEAKHPTTETLKTGRMQSSKLLSESVNDLNLLSDESLILFGEPVVSTFDIETEIQLSDSEKRSVISAAEEIGLPEECIGTLKNIYDLKSSSGAIDYSALIKTVEETLEILNSCILPESDPPSSSIEDAMEPDSTEPECSSAACSKSTSDTSDEFCLRNLLFKKGKAEPRSCYKNKKKRKNNKSSKKDKDRSELDETVVLRMINVLGIRSGLDYVLSTAHFSNASKTNWSVSKR